MVLQGRSGVGGFDIIVVIDHLPQQPDGRADGGFCHGMGRITHGVLHRDALFFRRVEVDVVHARRRRADQPQTGELPKGLAAEDHLVGNHYVGFAAAVDDLIAGGRFVTRVAAQRTDGPEVGASEAVFVQKYDVRLHILVFCKFPLAARPGFRTRIRSAAPERGLLAL